jgi:hypothetical protein
VKSLSTQLMIYFLKLNRSFDFAQGDSQYKSR